MDKKHISLYCFLLALLTGILPLYAQNSDNFDSLMNEGIKAHDAQHYEEAIECYQRALELHPRSKFAYYEMGFTYYVSGKLEEAIRSFEQAEKGDQDDMEGFMLGLYSLWGSALDDMGHSEEAIRIYDKGLKLGSSQHLFYNKGVTCYRLNRLDEAKECLAESLKLNRWHSNSLRLMANLLEGEGERIAPFILRCIYLLVTPYTKEGSMAQEMLDLIASAPRQDDKGAFQINVSSQSPTKEWDLVLGMAMALPLEEGKEADDQQFCDAYRYLKTRIGKVYGSRDLGVDKISLPLCRDVYAPFLFGICEKGDLDVFCALATYSDTFSRLWLQSQEERLDKFFDWMDSGAYVSGHP